MERASTEIERLREQVVRELADLPLSPWRPRSRRRRAVCTVALAWRRTVAFARGQG
jgi:hypothetical protein